MTQTADGQPFDPYAYTLAGKESPPELAALRRYLERGDWKSGAGLYHEMGKAIPPGMALRYAREHVKAAAELTDEELIARGRRLISSLCVGRQVGRGGLLTRPEKLTKAHLSGREPWQVRDPYPGAIGTKSAARLLGLNEETIPHWIRKGYAPAPPRAGGVGQYIITAEYLVVLKRLVKLWSGGRWLADPRSVWDEEAASAACPHCGGPLNVEFVIGKPYGVPTQDGAAEEVPSEPSQEV